MYVLLDNLESDVGVPREKSKVNLISKVLSDPLEPHLGELVVIRRHLYTDSVVQIIWELSSKVKGSAKWTWNGERRECVKNLEWHKGGQST